MPKQTPIVELRAVTRKYESAGPDGLDILRGVDLRVDPAESAAIVGPSGSGKSTLLNIMGTLDRPSSGEVLFNGRNVLALSERQLAEARNREIGFIFQLHHLLPQCTIMENVLVPSLVSRESEGAEERARRLLDRVGLSDRLTHRPAELSGGECQRVAVVRALINRPKLLLADEPTGSLDRAGAENLARLLVELNREESVALVVVTHSAHLAQSMGRTYELRDGRIVT